VQGYKEGAKAENSRPAPSEERNGTITNGPDHHFLGANKRGKERGEENGLETTNF
jgi:hypothetical protein